nr:MAG: coat protein [Coral holobiont-associated alphaflexivirus 1]
MNFDLSAVDLELEHVHVSNSIATLEDLRNICATWRLHQFTGDTQEGRWIGNATEAQLRTMLLHMVIEFADNGTSGQTKYDAGFGHDILEFVPDGQVIYLEFLASIIKRFCTVRQFASFYAPMYWNWAISNECPPAKWMKFGYKNEEKYAGFDFFFGVLDSSSLGGAYKNGLVRLPTESEIIANQTNSRVSIYRDVSAREGGHKSTFVEVTRGSTVPKNVNLGLLPAPSTQ